jgi:hypothetical protein
MVRQTQAEQSRLLARQQRLLTSLAGRVAPGAQDASTSAALQDTSTSAALQEDAERADESEATALAKLREERTARARSSNGLSLPRSKTPPRTYSPSRSHSARDASVSGSRVHAARHRVVRRASRGPKEDLLPSNDGDALEWIALPAATESAASFL